MEKEKFEKFMEKSFDWMNKNKTLVTLVLFTIILGVITYIRYIPSQAYYFNDPDTFHHYEVFKRVLHDNFNLFYDKIYPPTGGWLRVNFGLYIIWKLLALPFIPIWGVLKTFKVLQVIMAIITSIGLFLLTRRITRSDIAGLTSIVVFNYSLAGWMRTYAGNARGDNVFLGFLLLSTYFLLLSLDVMKNRKDNKKYLLPLTTGILLGLTIMAWSGSRFMIPFITGVLGIIVLRDILDKNIESLKVTGKTIILSLLTLILTVISFWEYSGTQVMGYETKMIIGILGAIGVLSYGLGETIKRYENSRWLEKKFVFSSVIVLGVISIILFVVKFSFLFAGSLRDFPVYRTVQELAPQSIGNLISYYTMFMSKLRPGGDGLFYIIGFVFGVILFTWELFKDDKYRNIIVSLVTLISIVHFKYPTIKIGYFYFGIIPLTLFTVFLYKLYKDPRSVTDDDITIVSIFTLFGIFVWWAVRFTFFGVIPVAIGMGYVMKKLFEWVMNSNVSINMKTVVGSVLVIFILSSMIVNGKVLYVMADGMRGTKVDGVYSGSVPPEWISTLKWIKEHSNETDSVLTWWDYGYWIESSLLSNRPAVIDGGYAREYDFLVGKFLSEPYGYQFDWDKFNVRYIIVWSPDFGKMNAINYLGGIITEKEKDNTLPLMVLKKTEYHGKTVYTNGYVYAILEGNKTIVHINGNNYATHYTILEDGIHEVKGEGYIPYVSIVYGNYMVIMREGIFKSNWYKMLTLSTLMNSNLRPVYMAQGQGEILVYEFKPYSLQAIKLENGTITHLSDVNGTIPANSTFIITVFGKENVTGDIVVRFKDGSIKTILSNVTVTNNTINEFKIPVELHNVTNVYFRTWGNVGKFTGDVIIKYPDGSHKRFSPENIAPVINKKGNYEFELSVKFDKRYELRVGIDVYAIVIKEDKEGYVKSNLIEITRFPGKIVDYNKEKVIFTTNIDKTPKEIRDELVKKYGKNSIIYVYFRPYVEGWKLYDIGI